MDENKKVIRKPIALRGETNIENNTNDLVNEIEQPKEINRIDEMDEMPTKTIKKTSSSPTFITCLLTVLLIATYLLIPKLYEPAKNIIFNASITAYPFTFLVIMLAARKYSFKEMRKSIYTSSIVFILFLFIMCIGLIPIANSDTMNYNVVIQFLFGINNIPLGNLTLFYPQLSLVLGIVLSYIIGHLVYLFIYYSLRNSSMEGMIVMLALFISFIIDRTIFMPIYYSKILINQENSFAYFVKCLTGEYVSAILVVILIVLIYSISKLFIKKES